VSRDSRSAPVRLTIFIVLGLCWLSSAFLGGYLVGQADALAGNHRLGDLVVRASSLVGLPAPIPTGSAEAVLSPDQQTRFKVFWETWGLLEREFYNRPAVDSQSMTYGAVKGLVESLGDPYTAFSTPRERELNDASLRGSFDGVGVQVDQREGRLRVVSPIEGSPAQRAGIRTGDVIAQVDGRDLTGLPLNDVVQLIRGPRGTVVTLTILREGETDPLVFPLERGEIKLEMVRGKLLDEGLGYIRITSFSANSGADTSAAVKRLLESAPRGFVLDLRSNPGGYLHAAVDVASQFLSDGVVLYQQAAGGARQEYRARPGGQATTLPVVVLIDKGSASASEIVAAALRDNGRATLVGEMSYGKGSVQTVHTLSDLSGLRVTSAIWLTPAGQPLERQGLQPDLVVAPGPADQAAQDLQLSAAVKYLQEHAEAPRRLDGV
jgi:carboxyl-terminal processing protease